MAEEQLTEFHGGLQKIFRMDRYLWEARRSVLTKNFEARHFYLENLWMELNAWMSKTEKEKFMKLWAVFTVEYKLIVQKQRDNTFWGDANNVELHLRMVSKIHNLDMKEYKGYVGGGAIVR